MVSDAGGHRRCVDGRTIPNEECLISLQGVTGMQEMDYDGNHTDTSAEDCIRQAQGLRSSMWTPLGVSPHGGELAFSLYPSFRNIPISGRWTCLTIRHMVLPSDVLMNICETNISPGGTLAYKAGAHPPCGAQVEVHSPSSIPPARAVTAPLVLLST